MERVEDAARVATGAPELAAAEHRDVALRRLVGWSAAAVAAVYVLRFALIGDPEVWRGYFLKEHGLLERTEGLLWVPAVVLNVRLLAGAMRARSTRVVIGWFALLSFLCVFAFGEEIGWGQHLFGFKPRGWLLENNVQKDVTLHNLDFAGFLGFERGSVPARAIRKTMGAAPYLFCLGLWVGLPLLRRSARFPLLRRIPLPRDPIVAFFAANFAVYLAVDLLVADVAEIFELVIALVFTLVALDFWARRSSLLGAEAGR